MRTVRLKSRYDLKFNDHFLKKGSVIRVHTEEQTGRPTAKEINEALEDEGLGWINYSSYEWDDV